MLPRDRLLSNEAGVGFSDDNGSFLTLARNGKDWNCGKLTFWSLTTGQPSQGGEHQLPKKQVSFTCNTPMGLDDLRFQNDEDQWRVIDETTGNCVYVCLRASGKPILARRSKDRRWLAVEWESGDTVIIDLCESLPTTHIKKESIIQFSPDSAMLFTSSRLTGDRNVWEERGLNAWSLSAGKKQWFLPEIAAPSIKHFLQQRQSEISFHDFKMGGRDNTTTMVFSSDRDFFPIAFGNGQGFIRQNKQEWASPLADWLNNHNWHGWGSGRYWTHLIIINLKNGSLITPGPVRGIQGMDLCTSSDGRFLALRVRDQAPWFDHWVIYTLPFERSYGKAVMFAAAMTFVLLAICWLWQLAFKRQRN